MTYKDNVKAVLECFFEGFKDEIIDRACDRLCAIEHDRCIEEPGHWIPIPYELDYETDAKCSLCFEQVIDGINYKYCPNCGTKMIRGGQDE